MAVAAVLFNRMRSEQQIQTCAKDSLPLLNSVAVLPDTLLDIDR